MLAQTGKLGFATMAVAAMAIMAVPTLAHAKADDNGTAAVVNGDKITKSQVETVMKLNNVKEEDQPKVYPVIVDKMIDQKLIDEAVAKADVQKTPEFQQRMAAAKEQIAQQIYLESYLKDKVTDKAVKAEYEKFKKDNKGKEEVHLSQILVKSEDEAKQVIKDLSNGAKFADLAKERSIDPSAAKNGGEVAGSFTKSELMPSLSDAIFKLKPGSYTQTPIKGASGWQIVYVDSKDERTVPEFKTVEGAIRDNLAKQEAQKLMESLVAKAEIKRFDINGKPITTSKD